VRLIAGSTSHKKNVLYNLVGLILPIAVGLVAVPFIIAGLGPERFGIISISWMIIGYFSLFDMGIGRALTQAVAEKIGSGRLDEIPALFWTSLAFMTAMAVGGAVLVMLFADALTGDVLKISAPLRKESLHSFYILALSIPAVIISSSLTGFLSAYHRFDILNAIRVPMSMAMLVAPLVVIPFTHDLVIIIAIMTCIRFIFCWVYYRYCLTVEPRLGTSTALDGASLRPLLKFGGWLTVSNIVGPIMVSFDRFVIGASLSMTSVAYYATPFEAITKLWIVPTAVNGVTYPLYAATYSHDQEVVAKIFSRSLMAIFFLLYPVILLVITFAYDGMSLWINDEFAQHSYRVLQWLAIGVFLNCLAQVPYTLIQGSNSPDITCKLHVAELAIYIPLLFVLISRLGIEGAAIAWLLRAAVDSALLFWIAVRKNRLTVQGMLKAYTLMGMAMVPLVHLGIVGSHDVHYGVFTFAVALFVLSVMCIKPYQYLHAR
jgi:O-antigen/teichoic acid export membrane protein